jgi:hypothetical protein
MYEPQRTELVIRTLGEVRQSPMGHLYIEAVSDRGVVAFWGRRNNMRHIDQLRRAVLPFLVSCDCIQSNWNQHDLWVHEKHNLYSIGPIASATPDAGSEAISGNLRVVLTCRRCGHQRGLTPEELKELGGKYGIKAKRSVPGRELHRLRCEKCGARDVRQTERAQSPDDSAPTRRGSEIGPFRNCSVCQGTGGPDGRCSRCWGRGVLDSAD